MPLSLRPAGPAVGVTGPLAVCLLVSTAPLCRFLQCLEGWKQKLSEAGYDSIVFEDPLHMLLQQVQAILIAPTGRAHNTVGWGWQPWHCQSASLALPTSRKKQRGQQMLRVGLGVRRQDSWRTRTRCAYRATPCIVCCLPVGRQVLRAASRRSSCWQTSGMMCGATHASCCCASSPAQRSSGGPTTLSPSCWSVGRSCRERGIGQQVPTATGDVILCESGS